MLFEPSFTDRDNQDYLELLKTVMFEITFII